MEYNTLCSTGVELGGVARDYANFGVGENTFEKVAGTPYSAEKYPTYNTCLFYYPYIPGSGVLFLSLKTVNNHPTPLPTGIGVLWSGKKTVRWNTYYMEGMRDE